MGLEYQRLVQVAGSVPVSPSIILFDDLEGQLNWEGNGVGTDWIVDKFAGVNACMRGNFGLRVATRATTPAATDWASAARNFALREFRILELSFYFRHATPVATKFIEVAFQRWDGSFYYYPSFRWDGSAAKWLYWSATGVFVDLPGGAQNMNSACWNFVKCVVSFRENQYKYFQCNDLVLRDLKFPIWRRSSAVVPYIQVVFCVRTTAASQQVAYFDDVLVQEAV